MDLNNKKCKSVREFFDYLIASGQLLESQKSYDEKTRTKLINGRVTGRRQERRRRSGLEPRQSQTVSFQQRYGGRTADFLL